MDLDFLMKNKRLPFGSFDEFLSNLLFRKKKTAWKKFRKH